jgi:hypothetical protein
MKNLKKAFLSAISSLISVPKCFIQLEKQAKAGELATIKYKLEPICTNQGK